MRMTIVMAVLDAFEMSLEAIKRAIETLDAPSETQFFVIDNGSQGEFDKYLNSVFAPNMQHPAKLAIDSLAKFGVIRHDRNTGNYPIFQEGARLTQDGIVAFLHSDVFVMQKGWDSAVRGVFMDNERLGLVGFIGSTEIDNWAGRGGGTVSNMRAVEWDGRTMSSEAEVHGKRDKGFIIDGAVVDGCVMIFRRSVLESIGQKEGFVLHHWYDRLLSCQVIEAGFKVGILGMEFAHLSGQTANHSPRWVETSRDWFKATYGIEEPRQWAELRADWVKRGNSPSKGKVPDQWDYASYLEGEYQFLTEYRDQKRIVPNVGGRRA